MLLADDGRPAGVNWNYTRREMLADGTIHVLGVVLGVAGTIGIVVIAALSPISWVERAGVAIYAAGLVSMLGVSATYNMWPVGRRKWLLRRFDHALIYLMIAGTYTPLVALVGDGVPAWGLLGTVWLVAGIGIALKLILPGRYDRAAIGLYLTLGWSGVVAYDAVIGRLAPDALWLLATGGLLYSLGVIFHVWRSLPYQNAIWHAFVLAATACHYGAVLVTVMRATA
jgi:hemolysin III